MYSHCYFAGNYGDELGEWEKGNRESFVRKVQLSFFKASLFGLSGAVDHIVLLLECSGECPRSLEGFKRL